MRGDRVIERNGYLMDYVGKGRYQYRHRLVMMDFIRRPLERWEIVHHINGNKHDNRVENLEVMTQREHRRLHGGTRFGPRPDLRKPEEPCAFCGKLFRKRAKRVLCCSQSCGQRMRYGWITV